MERELYIEKSDAKNDCKLSTYEEIYKSCFEGSNEDVERKLEVWDSVHRMTR